MEQFFSFILTENQGSWAIYHTQQMHWHMLVALAVAQKPTNTKVLKGCNICPTIQLKHTGSMFHTVFQWEWCNMFYSFLHTLVIRRAINKKTRLTLSELHHCADAAGLILICCSLSFVILTFGLFSPGIWREMALCSCPLMSMRLLDVRPMHHQREWSSVVHTSFAFSFLFLIFSLPPSLAHSLLLSPACSCLPPLPLMSSIPYYSCIRATLIWVVGWNGTFNGFFSFPGWEGRVMC